MKYIDAEKLKANIKGLQCEQGFDTGEAESAYQFAIKDILAFIDTLQQEQSEVQNGKFVFPKYLYARTKNNKTIDMSYAPQDMTAVEYIRNDFVEQEQPMPDSTKLIKLWHEDKEMLKEKDFRDDPWRLAYNAFMCGFGRGIAVNRQEQPEVDLEKAARYVYESWMGCTMDDVRRDMAELGKVLNARKK